MTERTQEMTHQQQQQSTINLPPRCIHWEAESQRTNKKGHKHTFLRWNCELHLEMQPEYQEMIAPRSHS